ncbi:protein phosphatase 2C domain-containing protein [Verrucosispora sp. NA02020]|uniref:protein phosphatase 2C domain-containing protein n=1 Tax=Verrucosispora sp. NA02020 TaxID=2742132 RepID=UPI001591DB55|nr:protein phosphatase 2C domain-containing protein [Verrucosispora sp. NA02020]QKW12237.1 protein phosphatase 2C domain-containing protein [Verrucosispora sp. NA02020]
MTLSDVAPPTGDRPGAQSDGRPCNRFGVPAVGVPGRAALELPAGPPSQVGDGADHELSECSFPGVQVRAASVRGLLHRYRAEPRQDRYSIAHDAVTDTLIVSVCDGVGSLRLSHEAAGFVAREMPRSYRSHGEWPAAISEVNQRLTGYADELARIVLEAGSADAGMATTFVGTAICLTGPRTASIAWTDDSTVWSLVEGEWSKLTADPAAADIGAAGPQAVGNGLHTGGVRALPHPRPRFRTIEVPVGVGALFVMSDGVGVPLESAREVRDTLAGWWATAPDVFTFASQVGFARKSHLDDRTVVGLWFDEPAAEPTGAANEPTGAAGDRGAQG